MLENLQTLFNLYNDENSNSYQTHNQNIFNLHPVICTFLEIFNAGKYYNDNANKVK